MILKHIAFFLAGFIAGILLRITLVMLGIC